MKTRLTLTIGFLTLVGMLLVNFVLMTFWKRDALRREAEHDQIVLAHVQALLPAKIAALHTFSEKIAFTDFYNGDKNGQLLFSFEQFNEKKSSAPPVDSEQITSLLASAIAAAKTGEQVSHSVSSFFGWPPACTYFLVSAQPVTRQGRVVGAVAVARRLDTVSQTLWKAEKTVLVYILVNLLILVIIGFFRMTKLVGRPVERLMQLADQYNSHDPFLFAAESSGSEFGKLSNSLNSMLTRIEDDRQLSQKTVAALEIANRKLTKQRTEMIHTEKLASVGRMAAGLAHEVGNPLAVVQGYLGLLAQSQEQSTENKDFIRRSEQELQRVNNLIRQLLDFSRAAKGKPEFFSLHELLRSVIDLVQIQSVFKGVELTSELTAKNDEVYADQEQLRQVFVNCLLNSADAMHMDDCLDEQKKQGRITVATASQEISPEGEEETKIFLCIRITDNGIGVAKEQLPVIFDPFYTTKEPGKGTGLGLSVSRSIIEQIGGKMEMKSKEQQGCEMSIFLPLIGTNNDHIVTT